MSKKISKGEEVMPVIRPCAIVKGAEDHVMNDMIEKGSAFNLVGICRVPGRNEWFSVTASLKGLSIESLDVGLPNLHLIALDEAKIAFVDKFMNNLGEADE